jgi:hypothetical protein
VAKVGTSNPDSTISLNGCSAYIENNNNNGIYDTQCPDLESKRIFSENNTFLFINFKSIKQKVPSWLP